MVAKKVALAFRIFEKLNRPRRFLANHHKFHLIVLMCTVVFTKYCWESCFLREFHGAPSPPNPLGHQRVGNILATLKC